jgi:hypothetical protein
MYIESVRGYLLNIAGKPKKVKNGEKCLTRRTLITIRITYPIGCDYVDFKFKHHKDKFTVNDLYRLVKRAYRQIYQKEEEYGVWGHYMGDLILVGFRQYAPGKFSLCVES